MTGYKRIVLVTVMAVALLVGLSVSAAGQAPVKRAPPELSPCVPHALTISDGDTAALQGTFVAQDDAIVSMTASAGILTYEEGVGVGCWRWSLTTTDGVDTSQDITLKVTDSKGAEAEYAFQHLVGNYCPTLTIGRPVTRAAEGCTAQCCGEFADSCMDCVTITASAGIVTYDKETNEGCWRWSLTPGDGEQSPAVVTIRATDGRGAYTEVDLDLTGEGAPAVSPS